MNRKLTDEQIELTADALQRSGVKVTGRALRVALRRDYGVVGRTDRLFAVCRARQEPRRDAGNEGALLAALRRELVEAERRRLAAEEACRLALARAERSEAREVVHQDRWASEIHALRGIVQQLKGERVRRQALDQQVLRLQQELHAVRGRLASYEAGE